MAFSAMNRLLGFGPNTVGCRGQSGILRENVPKVMLG
jgi:hypothetical protein